jgi:DNA-binding NtrC family response regulator
VAPGGSANSRSVSPAAVLPEVDGLRNFSAEAEKALILRTLKSFNGARAEAARRLGVSRSDLGYKIAKHGLSDSNR